MNYLVQRAKLRSQVINVPDGLPELLSDISREVLRCQPTKECLCQFIIDYLHSIIVTREKALVAKSIINRALKKVDEIISDMCICDMTKEKAEEMALVMEECFKRFLEKRRCERNKKREIIRFDEEDMLEELIKKCKFTEDDLKISRPLIEAAYNRFVQAYMAAEQSTDGTEALYQYFRERELKRWEEKIRNEAATKIQANFRGFMVRRSLLDKLLPKLPTGYKIGMSGDIPSELFHEMDKAARVIQKFFKDHFPSVYKSEDVPEEEQEHSVCSDTSKETIIAAPTFLESTGLESAPERTTVIAEGPPQLVEEEQVVDETVLEAEVEAEPETTEAPTAEPEPAPEVATEPEPAPEPEPAREPEPAAEPEPPAAEPAAEEAPPNETAEEPPAEE